MAWSKVTVVDAVMDRFKALEALLSRLLVIIVVNHGYEGLSLSLIRFVDRRDT